MPTMYAGPLLGEVEVDELHEYDYGKEGVSKVGILWIPATPEEKARTRANLLHAAELSIRKRMEAEGGSTK